MQSRTMVRMFVRLMVVVGLFLLSAQSLFAQSDIPVTPTTQDEVEVVPAELGEASLVGVADTAAVTEIEAKAEGEDLTGADTTDDPNQYDGHEPPEFAAGSVTTQVEITENGETPVAISAPSLLFMPAVTGNAAVVDQVESMEAASADGTSSIAGSPTLLGDFNGDGRDDMVVGVPYEDTGLANVGFVHVIYGGAAGLAAAGNQFWSQDSAGIADISEANDYFGWSLAVGDFNGDNRDDLAIGVPYEDIPGVVNAGAVNVIYGPLGFAGNQIWTQNTLGVLDAAEPNDLFGQALTVGDFNGDGRDDLAIGVPNEDWGAVVDAGAVNVLYGAAGGLSSANNQFWSQTTAGILDVVETGDAFGRSLAAGDFNSDGRDDLAVGVPYEDIAAIANAGAVNVLYGSVARLTAAGNQFWSEDTGGIAGVSEANDNYGWSLVALDFNANNRDDLAIGIPYEDFGALTNNGAVNIIFGAAAGLNAAGNGTAWQNAAGVLDVAESNDVFGYALTAGDFNGDNRDDLGVGVPFEDVGAIVNAGAVNVLYNLSVGGNQFFTQDTAGVLDIAEANDLVGYSLAVGDFNNNGRDDLVVGVPFENLGAAIDAGGVNVIYGPLGAGGQQFWWQDSAGIAGIAEPGDAFGLSNQ